MMVGKASALAFVTVSLVSLGMQPASTGQQLKPAPVASRPSGDGRARAAAQLVLVEGDAKEHTIRFGDRLDLLVTLQNQGSAAIAIPAGALLLKNEGWTGWPGGGSGLGESILSPAGSDSKQVVL